MKHLLTTFLLLSAWLCHGQGMEFDNPLHIPQCLAEADCANWYGDTTIGVEQDDDITRLYYLDGGQLNTTMLPRSIAGDISIRVFLDRMVPADEYLIMMVGDLILFCRVDEADGNYPMYTFGWL